ncbi:cyclic lactone autoinducer peptide [Salipaludibacillus neizhouensis]|uniref:Cyclic lactone autoinducer peptide n=1 Tax=Salipaludibacillus neizhouensis TaxID=885475 RepID=A0A3A9K7R0_9BACI|nr:cyclic lactone autoinducer peptide [Salipaludibacillus neizhouensis]RKL68259.1 cyclic lactone autoinducer peptide [Salipaludibacillus neizhouensis]
MRKTAKVLSSMTRQLSTVFVSASSPLVHVPKIPKSLRVSK